VNIKINDFSWIFCKASFTPCCNILSGTNADDQIPICGAVMLL